MEACSLDAFRVARRVAPLSSYLLDALSQLRVAAEHVVCKIRTSIAVERVDITDKAIGVRRKQVCRRRGSGLRALPTSFKSLSFLPTTRHTSSLYGCAMHRRSCGPHPKAGH